jgi:hypothetical protein
MIRMDFCKQMVIYGLSDDQHRMTLAQIPVGEVNDG